MTAVAPLPGYVAGTAVELERDVLAALDTVLDPELDQPITELRFVRSILIDEAGVTVHLRLPTSFCSPNFAYLMGGSDALDALEDVNGVGQVRVLLDDHHDSDKINAGLDARAGYKGDVRRRSTREPRRTAPDVPAQGPTRPRWNAPWPPRSPRDGSRWPRWIGWHCAICHADTTSRRCCDGAWNWASASAPTASSSSTRRGGTHCRPIRSPMRLRFARSVRISMEGNSHFCRGLLATRYADDDECDGGASGPVITNLRETPRAHHRSEQE